jgi:hypothetical protein
MLQRAETAPFKQKKEWLDCHGLLDLRSQLSHCFNTASSSKDLMQDIISQLQKFGRLGVRIVISEILNCDDLLESVAARSYLHNNGFLKILLLKDPDFRVRLHIWMPETDSKETLHNHCWHLASTIINGELTSEIWQDSGTKNAEAFDEYLYRGKFVDPILLGQAKVELVETVTHKAGDAYVLESHVLHKIVSNGNKMTATLICRTNDVRVWSRNVILNSRVPNVRPTYLGPEELRTYLNRYLWLESEQEKAQEK